MDGTIIKTDKSALLKILERTINDHGQPQDVDVYMIDGFFLLYQLLNVPKTYGEIALKILEKVVSCKASKVFLLFDVHKEPSIKDNEHIFRDNFTRDVNITGRFNIYFTVNHI